MIDFFPSRAVAVLIGGFGVHWYGLLYFAAFILAMILLPRLQRFRDLSLSSDDVSRLIARAVIGVIVGGRLGYVLFYNPAHFLAEPFDIVKVWEGGMSSHGGFVGVTIMLLHALRHRRSDILSIADVIVIPIALGLALGRIGNFINLELYGTQTSLPWGMEFPGAEGLRHPVQLYAVAKDLLIAVVCFLHLRRRPFIAGRTLALFLMSYGVLRFLLEFVREQHGVFFGPLSEGQWLTIPVFAAGAVLWAASGKNETQAPRLKK